MSSRRFRINRDVHPYGGRVLVADFVDDQIVRGFVVLSWLKYATGMRTYKRTELQEIEQ